MSILLEKIIKPERKKLKGEEQNREELQKQPETK